MFISFIKNLKIKYKFFLSFSILLFLVIVLLLLLINHLEEEAVLTEVEDKVTGLSGILAYSSVRAIVSEDFLELQGLIESIKRREDVIEVSIINKDGKEIIEFEKITIFTGGCQPGFEEENNGIFGSLELI